jgi:hypothetical protein
MTSIVIPNSVTLISDSTFQSCSSLTSITVPGSVTSIGRNTFYRCSSLTSINLPESITAIGSSAFGECTSLTFIVIPHSITSIEDMAFVWCTSLTSIALPESVTSIGSLAFRGCSSLTSIDIPDSVTSIGDSAFGECTNLTSIVIPNRITWIGNWAFDRCTSLTSIVIPNSVTSIGSSAFNGCSQLGKAVFLGNAPTSFGSYYPYYSSSDPSSVFASAAVEFTIYFIPPATGFTTPEWNGYPCEALTAGSFKYWAASHGLTGEEATQNATPAGDGVINLMKYTLGLDPRIPASAGSLPELVTIDGQPVFRFTRALSATEVTCIVETSTDLVHWTSILPTSVVSTTATTETLVAILPTDHPRLFARLKVTTP